MNRLFGTDGVRGIANTELTCELAMDIGRAVSKVIAIDTDKRPKILIGKDTRVSSNMIEGALLAGLCSVGADVVLLGFIPTPAVAYLVRKYKADAGIMISASHNSFEFNGIKIFNSQGYKLADILEEQIELIVSEMKYNKHFDSGTKIGKVFEAPEALRDYIDHVKSTVPVNALKGIKIAVDCANGSASATAKQLFEELGAEVKLLFAEPNGININNNCGSTNMQELQSYVKQRSLDCGIAFDGDADRCMIVDENGNIIDGDFIMAICSADLKSRGKLNRNTVVGTVMTNMGLIKLCDINGVRFIPTNVGDKYVLEEMMLEGYNFGGEQSGHIIFLDYATTGDGQLTAVQFLSIINRRQAKVSSLATIMKKYPQVIINVKITAKGKLRFYTDTDIQLVIEECKKILGKDGRVLVRASGTEPLIRVMVEGENQQEISRAAEKIAQTISDKLT